MNDLRLAVVGAAGRMGRMLLQTIPDTLGMRLSGALEMREFADNRPGFRDADRRRP